MNQHRILIVDDQTNMRHMMSVLLTDAGYDVDEAPDGEEALRKVREVSYKYIFCDIKMPKMDGMTFMKSAGAALDQTSVIMMSAYGSIDIAIEAMKLGAYDYISKPFKPDEILLTLKKAYEREVLKEENTVLRQRIEEIEGSHSFGDMVAKSKSMQDVFKLSAKVAQYDTTVLVTGQSGTGKELIAKAIHYSSKRNKKQIVPVNCAGIPHNLLESELFGYKKGAFTGADRDYGGLFEAAEGGTLFLDEIGDLPSSLQVKLLRVLQEGEIRPLGASESRVVDARIVAATSKTLEEEMKNGNFREDLYYRLNVMSIHLPPLAEHSEDIPLLCQFFMDRYNRKFGKAVQTISPVAMSMLLEHSWPGNVRELENMIERAVVLAEEQELGPENFPVHLQGVKINRGEGIENFFQGFSLKSGKVRLEEAMIRKALAKTRGNRTQAARLLEISHPSLLSKIKRYGIDG
ncbi:MAG: sigma-54 dependent transcriptional regulator [Desulfosalsimonadaceae bacterium]